MYTQKLHAGDPFPEVKATLLTGEHINLAETRDGGDWKMIVVYRGQHCPLCTKYLNELETHREAFRELGVEIVGVSADSKSQLESHLEKLSVNFPLAYGLTLDQLKTLGVYISDPRSEKETDHRFAEPGLFIVNEQGNLHVVDIANNPFSRPSLPQLLSGIKWIRDPENNYPIRGTYTA